MQELVKIKNVCAKLIPDGAPHEVILVLDATTGQNAHFSQVQEFKDKAGLTGLISNQTRRHGQRRHQSSRWPQKFKLPIYAIGVGEGIDDMQTLSMPLEFAKNLVGVIAASPNRPELLSPTVNFSFHTAEIACPKRERLQLSQFSH